MEANYPKALAFVLAAEGGVTEDPSDAGGLTNLGITQLELTLWNEQTAGFPKSVRDLTTAQAGKIYHKKYWLASGAASQHTGLDVVLFDTAVNMGITQAIKILQRVPVDYSARAACYHYLADRSAVYGKILAAHSEDRVFLNGWNNRLKALKQLVNELLPVPKVG